MSMPAESAGSDPRPLILAQLKTPAQQDASPEQATPQQDQALQTQVHEAPVPRPRRWFAPLLIGSFAAAAVAFHFLPLIADEIERAHGAQPWLRKLETAIVNRQLRNSVKAEDLDRWTSSLQSFGSLSQEERSALISAILLSNDKLEERLTRNASQLALLSQSVNRVSARVSEADKAVDDIFLESTRTNKRVDELRGTLDIEIPKLASATEARTKALQTDLSAISAITAEKITALAASINTLEARMSDAAAGDKQARDTLIALAANIAERQKLNDAEITELKKRGEGEQNIIATFDGRLEEANAKLASKSTSVLVMLRLLNSLSMGPLSASEIEELTALAAGDASSVQRISELKALIGAKAPPVYVLRDRLQSLQPRVAAIARFEDLSWIKQTIASTQDTLSNIGMASRLEPTISELAIEKAMLAMDSGDLATALFELEALGPKSARSLAVWINEAKLRLALNEAVEQLINRLIVQVKKS